MPIYHANFKARSQRSVPDGSVITFGAADDAAAIAIANIFAGATTGKLVSVTKRISVHNLASVHPVGTRDTATAITADAAEGLWKFRARNWKVAAEDDVLEALLLGVAYPIDAHGFVLGALSAPPQQPNTTHPVAVIRNVNIVHKR